MSNPVTVSYADADGLHTVELDLDALPSDVSPAVLQILAASGHVAAPVVEASPVSDQPADAPADATSQE